MRTTPHALCRVSLATILLAMSGCVSVDYQRDTDDSKPAGIRYYESSPYLLVYSNGSGGLVWQIITLPDLSRPMTITPSAWWSKAQLNLTFANGVLQQSTAGGDATTVPAAIISAATTFISMAATSGVYAWSLARSSEKPAPPKPSIPGFPAPYLFKISVNGPNVTFIGHQGSTVIRVPNSVAAAP